MVKTTKTWLIQKCKNSICKKRQTKSRFLHLPTPEILDWKLRSMHFSKRKNLKESTVARNSKVDWSWHKPKRSGPEPEICCLRESLTPKKALNKLFSKRSSWSVDRGTVVGQCWGLQIVRKCWWKTESLKYATICSKKSVAIQSNQVCLIQISLRDNKGALRCKS